MWKRSTRAIYQPRAGCIEISASLTFIALARWMEIAKALAPLVEKSAICGFAHPHTALVGELHSSRLPSPAITLDCSAASIQFTLAFLPLSLETLFEHLLAVERDNALSLDRLIEWSGRQQWFMSGVDVPGGSALFDMLAAKWAGNYFIVVLISRRESIMWLCGMVTVSGFRVCLVFKQWPLG